MSACHDMRSWNLEDGSRTPLIVISPPSPRQSSTLQPTANSTWPPRPGESPSLTLSVAKSPPTVDSFHRDLTGLPSEDARPPSWPLTLGCCGLPILLCLLIN